MSSCVMYEELIDSLRFAEDTLVGDNAESYKKLLLQASDAIEKLQKLFEVLKKYIRLGELSSHETKYIEIMYVFDLYEKEDFDILKEAFFPEPPKEGT